MRVSVAIMLVLVLGACVKLEVKPQEIVKDTVNTTKDAYESYRLEKSGYIERVFEHSIELRDDENEADAALKCLTVLRKVAEESSEGKTKILSQSTKISGEDSNRSMRCKLEAYIKQNQD